MLEVFVHLIAKLAFMLRNIPRYTDTKSVNYNGGFIGISSMVGRCGTLSDTELNIRSPNC